jgi:heme/copper-type cytochrome/quinol oxidase subunit 2
LIDPTTGKPLKRPASVYTVMLGVTVIVLIVCCVLLYFEWKSYNFEIRARLTQNMHSQAVEPLDLPTASAGRKLLV